MIIVEATNCDHLSASCLGAILCRHKLKLTLSPFLTWCDYRRSIKLWSSISQLLMVNRAKKQLTTSNCWAQHLPPSCYRSMSQRASTILNWWWNTVFWCSSIVLSVWLKWWFSSFGMSSPYSDDPAFLHVSFWEIVQAVPVHCLYSLLTGTDVEFVFWVFDPIHCVSDVLMTMLFLIIICFSSSAY